MRITILLSSLHGGGAEQVSVDLANAFAAAGHEVDVTVTTLDSADLIGRLRPVINVVDLRSKRMRHAVRPFIDHLRRRRPDSVLSVMSDANAVAAASVVCVRRRPRLVVTEHSYRSMGLQEGRPLARMLMRHAMRWAFRRADAVVGVSLGVTEDLVDSFGADPRKTVTIHNPVDLGRLTAETAGPSGHPWLDGDGPPVVLGVGRLEPQKDFVGLLHAFAEVRSRRPVRLVIVGSGGERGALERTAVALGVSADVDLPGFVNNVGAYLDRAAVFVLSSVREGFGNALAEAFSLGTPVVATDCHFGPAEILEGGRWGRLVPVSDVTALAEGIEDALDGRIPIPTQGARERFTLERAASAYLDLLAPTREDA